MNKPTQEQVRELERLLGSPMTMVSGKLEYIDESQKRYLTLKICQLFEPENTKVVDEEIYARSVRQTFKGQKP